jgi:general secretion pathway protein D
MKNLILKIMAVCVSGIIIPAIAQNSPDATSAPGGSPPAMSADNQSAPPQMSIPPSDDTSSDTNADSLRLNFQDVPLQMVLTYLSDAAGFVIIMDTQVHGNVSVISGHPMTRDQAVDLLNNVLNQNGYAAIRGGSDNQTLTIMAKNDAKTRDIPVKVGYDPRTIPSNDEIVTQIIPIRYVDASQLISDLSSFVSSDATIVANQAGNSIVITDTQENIHHLAEIIYAIDSSAAGETDIKVFTLKYANPNDVATELGNVFPSSTSGTGGQQPIRFGGGRGGGFGGFGGFGGGGFGGGGGPFGGGGLFGGGGAGGAAGGANSTAQRAQKQSQVQAVADGRTQSVIVMASKDLMPEIQGMIEQLDVPSVRDQNVYTVNLKNGDPNEVLSVLQSMFPQNSNARNANTTQNNDAMQTRQTDGATAVGNNTSQLSSGLNSTSSSGLGSGGGAGTP